MARNVGVDLDKIRSASVVPFEEDEGLYGINWDLDGQVGASLVGNKAEAEAELRRIQMRQRTSRLASNG